jgi:hypothetical protein
MFTAECVSHTLAVTRQRNDRQADFRCAANPQRGESSGNLKICDPSPVSSPPATSGIANNSGEKRTNRLANSLGYNLVQGEPLSFSAEGALWVDCRRDHCLDGAALPARRGCPGASPRDLAGHALAPAYKYRTKRIPVGPVSFPREGHRKADLRCGANPQRGESSWASRPKI